MDEDVPQAACLACGGDLWLPLPAHALSSMASDGRIMSRPLAKCSCAGCGLVRHVSTPRAGELKAIFSDDYRLSAMPLGDRFQAERHRLYAEWIVSLVADREFGRVFDIGAGNGSLLARIRALRPSADIAGLEPVDVAAAYGRQAGIDITTAFVEDMEMSGVRADLVIAVNVVEHMPDPIRFLQIAKAALAPGGRVLIICPDGLQPSTELLIFDHIYTITPEVVADMAGKVGLRLESVHLAPASIGPFRAYRLLSDGVQQLAPPTADYIALHAARAAYLGRWFALDEALCARLPVDRPVTAFGFGESAQLLRTYAPRAWGRVSRIEADVAGAFFGVDVDVYRSDSGGDAVYLLTVKQEAQARLADRLAQDGREVVVWADLVD